MPIAWPAALRRAGAVEALHSASAAPRALPRQSGGVQGPPMRHQTLGSGSRLAKFSQVLLCVLALSPLLGRHRMDLLRHGAAASSAAPAIPARPRPGTASTSMPAVLAAWNQQGTTTSIACSTATTTRERQLSGLAVRRGQRRGASDLFLEEAPRCSGQLQDDILRLRPLTRRKPASTGRR
ncbi:hypothetical protein ACPA9J_28080 [Pseudomonas aeruginosa]